MGRSIANTVIGRCGSQKIGLPLVIMILFGLSLMAGLVLPGTAGATTPITSCGDCHGYPPTDFAARSEGTGSFPGSHTRHATSSPGMDYPCATCHMSPNWTSFMHQDRNINMRVPLNGQWGTYGKGTAFPQTNITTFATCNGVYCHSTVQGEGGTLTGVTYASPTWGSAATGACGTCHAVPQTTGKHTKHLSWMSFRGMTTTSGCFICHAGAGEASPLHARGTIDLRLSTVYYGLTTATYNQPAQAPGTGYGQCSSVYCHGGWSTAGGTAMSPNWTSSTTPTQACDSCHRAFTSAPPLTGSHQKHSGNWSTAINLACSACHGATAGSNTHADLNVRWSFDQNDARISTIARYKGVVTGSTGSRARVAAYGSCNSIYCHSNVQAPGGGSGPTAWATPTWGNAGSAPCGSCHAVPNTTGAHANHQVLYGTTQSPGCYTCHNGAGDETVYHARGTINLRINTTYWGLTTALYSQGEHKAGGGNYGNCSNTMCHGGPSKNWGSVTTDHQCTKCHGRDWTSSTYTLNYAAPGYTTLGHDVWGSVGALSGGVSDNPQVGAHDAHLRGLNTITQAVACVQCHTVPATPNTANHNNTLRRAEITWGSMARANAAAATWLTTGYQCSNVYCHGGAMPRGDTSGFNRTPTWNSGTYLVGPVYSQATTILGGCGTCHGAPPTKGSSAGNHNNKTLNDCNSCHPHVAVGGAISTVSFHMDGVLQAITGCNGCHDYDTRNTIDWGAGSASGGLTFTSVSWGAHAKHINHLKTVSGTTLDPVTNTFGGANFNVICGVCHSQNKTVDHGADGGTTTRNINFNGSTARQFGATAPWYSSTGKSCSNLDCHYGSWGTW
jgi:predicted CxxxxCH...CXXCH cytochrome family protein